MNPTFGSLFAGVGGFDLGFENAGFDCKFQVEWDDNCQQTLAHHWPNVPRWGDVSEVNGADLPPVDVITYGFPCQDLSVAGKRAGLNGERSNLFFEAVRIIQEMRQATNGLYPTFAVAENVAGLLNADKGDAMARVLDTLAEAGALVIEWCLLDAQWFGVPQRRRRVFVTACFDPATADRCPNQIFPVAPSGARNPKEIEQERKGVAALTANGVGTCGADDNQAQAGHLIPYQTSNLSDHAEDESGTVIQPAWWDGGQVADTLTTTSDGQRMPDKNRLQAVVFEPKSMLEENWASAEAKNSLRSGESKSSHVVVHEAVVFTAQRVGEEPRVYTDATPSLLSRMGTGGNNTPMVAQTCAETSGALLARDHKDINTDGLDSKLVVQHDVVPTLRSGGDGGIPSSRGEHVIAFDSTWSNYTQPNIDVSPTVKVGSGLGIPSPPAVAQPNLAVRRLTPLECERLMGWPDNHTLPRADGKDNSDSTRYRMCGNGVATPVATWLAKHLHPLL